MTNLLAIGKQVPVTRAPDGHKDALQAAAGP